MRFQLREKMFAIGDDYWIETDTGQRAFRVDGKALRIRKTLVLQTEVLELLADGLPAKVIATRLGVAEATIRAHIRAILVELGTHSQLEAIAKARGLQLVE